MFFFIPFPTQLKIKSIFLKTQSNNISCAFHILNPLIIMALLTQQRGSVLGSSLSKHSNPSEPSHMQSPKDAGTQGGTLGPLHFAGNGSRKKTAQLMALLVLWPAPGGEDWRSSGTRSYYYKIQSWVGFQVILVLVWIRNTTAELKTIPKMQPSPSNLVKQKPCTLWISLSYYYGPRHIWRGEKCKIKLLKYNLHQWERNNKKKKSLFY